MNLVGLAKMALKFQNQQFRTAIYLSFHHDYYCY